MLRERERKKEEKVPKYDRRVEIVRSNSLTKRGDIHGDFPTFPLLLIFFFSSPFLPASSLPNLIESMTFHQLSRYLPSPKALLLYFPSS